MKFFIEAQFGYCLLVLMFHGRVLNRKINQLHQRSLRIVYKGIINFFKKIILLLFTTETFKVWLSNYKEQKKTFQLKL